MAFAIKTEHIDRALCGHHKATSLSSVDPAINQKGEFITTFSTKSQILQLLSEINCIFRDPVRSIIHGTSPTRNNHANAEQMLYALRYTELEQELNGCLLRHTAVTTFRTQPSNENTGITYMSMK
ncbi:hypothetical protein DPMN_008615 [Dreissena polymorpha]|uniref:Uncharacterized protein n=1 Tax=Dreissena polymorpha TaxID=45954 RepID=A0A9D4MY41_DREPO|nr:hypothetical protein DPMN_008615 [Dreissena polymorpha]